MPSRQPNVCYWGNSGKHRLMREFRILNPEPISGGRRSRLLHNARRICLAVAWRAGAHAGWLSRVAGFTIASQSLLACWCANLVEYMKALALLLIASALAWPPVA